MATSGTISNTFRTGYQIRIVWTADSQSVANNTTTVTAKVQLVSFYNFTFTAGLSGNQITRLRYGIIFNNRNNTK